MFASVMEDIEESDVSIRYLFHDSCTQNSLEGIVPDIRTEELESYYGLASNAFITISGPGYMPTDLSTDFASNQGSEFLLGNEICDPLLATPLDTICGRADDFIADFCLVDGVAGDHGICEVDLPSPCAELGSSPVGQAPSTCTLDPESVVEASTKGVDNGDDVADYDVWDIIINQTDSDVLPNEYLIDSESFLADRIGPNSCLEPFASNQTLDALNTTAEHYKMENVALDNCPLACSTNFQGSFSGQYSGVPESALNGTMEDGVNTEVENYHHADESLLSTLQPWSDKEHGPMNFSDQESSSQKSSVSVSSCDQLSGHQGIQQQTHEVNADVFMKYKQCQVRSNEIECTSRCSTPQPTQKVFDVESGNTADLKHGISTGCLARTKSAKIFHANDDSWTLMHDKAVPQDENFPLSVKYCALLSKKKKTERKKMKSSMELNQLKTIDEAKQHLMLLGWDVEFRRDEHGCRYRYTSPVGVRFYSLSKACKAAMQESRARSFKQNEHSMDADAGFPQSTQSSFGQASATTAPASEGASKTRRIIRVKLSKPHNLNSNISETNSKNNPMPAEYHEPSQTVPNVGQVRNPMFLGIDSLPKKNSSTSMSFSSGPQFHTMQPAYCPRAVIDYIDYELEMKDHVTKGSAAEAIGECEQKGLQSKLHLLADSCNVRDEQVEGEHYETSRGKCFHSLHAACDAWMEDQELV